eukprot:CFRG4848T1
MAEDDYNPLECIQSFFLFNEKFGPREENEQDKVLFYYPSSERSCNQLANIGVCQGAIQFAHTFHPSEPVSFMETDHALVAITSPEPGYWVVLSILTSIPLASTSGYESTDGSPLGDTAHEKTISETGPMVVKGATRPIVMKLINDGFALFRLLHGDMEDIFTNEGVAGLRAILRSFFMPYLGAIRLTDSSIAKIVSGIETMKLHAPLYMDCVTLVSQIECVFPDVAGVILMFENRLIISSLPEEATQQLYRLLTTNEEGMPMTNSPDSSRTWRYVLGPSDIASDDSALTPLKVYIKKDDTDENGHRNGVSTSECSNEELWLIVLQRKHMRMVLLVSENLAFDREFYRLLSACVENSLDALSTFVAKHSVPSSTSSNGLSAGKYFIYDEDTMHVDNTLPGVHANSRSNATRKLFGRLSKTLHVLSDLDDILGTTASDDCSSMKEILVTEDERWIVARKQGTRRLFMTPYDRRQGTLTQASMEVDRLLTENAMSL